MTNVWDDSPFLQTSDELDVSDAIRALERLIAARSVKPTTRVVVEGTLAALRLELAD